FSTSGLFGSMDRCLAMVRRVAAIGVDEIACLIDFGVATDEVLGGLPRLKQVIDLAAAGHRITDPPSIAEEITAQRISHLQCTPSMASMLLADAPGRAALSRLEVLLVGGEALPVPLAKELRALVPGKLLNMYGPTETTVWSTACDLDEIGQFAPLGTSIANTALHVLDADGRECPALVAGELCIGGGGGVRGCCPPPRANARGDR